MGNGVGKRRRYNRWDHYDAGSRPIDEMLAAMREGVAIPVQEAPLDPRQLTDLLLTSSPSPSSSSTTATTSPSSSSLSSISSRPRLLDTPLPLDHPLALPDPQELEEAEAAARRAAAALAEQQRQNRNQYRHHGQAYVFWERVGLHPRLLSALRRMKFTHPTPTQEEVLPTVLEAERKRAELEEGWKHEKEEEEEREKDSHPTDEGEASERQKSGKKKSKSRRKEEAERQKDVLVCGETGSGKTLVFALPILQRLMREVYPLSSTEKGGGKEEEEGGVSHSLASSSSTSSSTAAVDGAVERVKSKQKGKDGEKRAEPQHPSSLSSPRQTDRHPLPAPLSPMATTTKKKTKRERAAKAEEEDETEAAEAHDEEAVLRRRDGRDGNDAQKRKKIKKEGGEEEEEDGAKRNIHQEETKGGSQVKHTTTTTGSGVGSSSSSAKLHTRLMHSLVLSPTRELALQIVETFRALCHDAPEIRVGCVLGGMATEKQQRILNQHPHVLIATPGRLWELLQKNEGCYLGHSISRRLHYVVLDEADRMLHAGKSFEELQQLLARIHCEMLPAGFAQEREVGAEVLEHEELEAGKWDEATQRFIPLKEWEANQKKIKTKKETGKKSRRQSVVSEEEEEEMDDSSSADASEDPLGSGSGGAALPLAHRRKDDPRCMPMPNPPFAWHQITTMVTSATLSLQTRYERKDYSPTKSRIRTSNAETMDKVMQELSIQPSHAMIFDLVSGTHKTELPSGSTTTDAGETVSGAATTSAPSSPVSTGIATKINETFLRCPDNAKELYMYYFLKTYAKAERTIIFVNAISMLRRLVKIIEILGIPVAGLHASMQQRQRLKFLDRFRSGEVKVLVATDVAARGLDVKEVRYVLHFQVPRSTDGYIHRCGRTARCGDTGLSLLLVNAQEQISFRKLLESTGRKESDLEVFALQPTVVHQLHAHLRIALQMDKLQKEISKSTAKNQWVKRMSNKAEIDASDMIDEEADQENKAKAKAIKMLERELKLLQQKFISAGGKGSFRTSATAIGAKLAEEKMSQRALRQTFLKDKK